mgnify:CR=1 FL=1
MYIGRTDQDYYGNLTHNIVVDANGDEINFGLPDIVITPKNNLSLGTYNYNKEVAKNVADAASFVPGVGEVIDATVAAQDASEGDYTTAAGLGLGLFIPNVIEKPAKWLWKKGKSALAARSFKDIAFPIDFKSQDILSKKTIPANVKS